MTDPVRRPVPARGRAGRPHPHRARRLARAGVLVSAVTTTVLAGGAAIGVVPVPDDVARADAPAALVPPAPVAGEDLNDTDGTVETDGTDTELDLEVPLDPDETDGPRDRPERAGGRRDAPLPEGSGKGRRAVFSESEQRVWIVRRGGEVASTYPVSGSRHDNLDPGTYEVYSRSRHAIGYGYTSTMDFFVRFANGDNAAIGFHSIPVDEDGEKLQTVAQLGVPRSAGCIRQRLSDAVDMWRFAELGTKVVVTA